VTAGSGDGAAGAGVTLLQALAGSQAVVQHKAKKKTDTKRAIAIFKAELQRGWN
jgi:hypothetical protein